MGSSNWKRIPISYVSFVYMITLKLLWIERGLEHLSFFDFFHCNM